MAKKVNLLIAVAVIAAGIVTLICIFIRANRHRPFSLPPMPPAVYGSHRVYDLRGLKGDLSIKLLRKTFPRCAAIGKLDGLAIIDRSKFNVSLYYIDIETGGPDYSATLAYVTPDQMVVTTSYIKESPAGPDFHQLFGDWNTYAGRTSRGLAFPLTSPQYGQASAALFPTRDDGWGAIVFLGDNSSSVDMWAYTAPDKTTAKVVLTKAVAALKIVEP